ncbi:MULTISPECIES: alpha/beta-type small acid-soluble spore protein [Paenibacillus]|uniref:alpha/beta-type small acid-soluble spore protein n=1 Tax=Paenibacillus TaxID=44249 RepID=UPI0003AA89E8|nr:alpha/beta-type small acid-soluble spore protein [Paenibacillus massiliensis]
MAGRNRSNNLVVQQANSAIQQLKYEAAQELGITIPADGYYGNMPSREAGSLGGYITKKLVQQAEASLAGTSAGQTGL